MSREHWWNNADGKKVKCLEENLSAGHPTWTALWLNLGLHGPRLVTSELWHHPIQSAENCDVLVFNADEFINCNLKHCVVLQIFFEG